MRQTKTEFYPDGFDESGCAIGPKTMVLNFFISNSRRWRSMSDQEKQHAWDLIETFKGRLEDIQQELFPGA